MCDVGQEKVTRRPEIYLFSQHNILCDILTTLVMLTQRLTDIVLLILPTFHELAIFDYSSAV